MVLLYTKWPFGLGEKLIKIYKNICLWYKTTYSCLDKHSPDDATGVSPVRIRTPDTRDGEDVQHNAKQVMSTN